MPHTNNKGTSKYISQELLAELVQRIEEKVISKKKGRGKCWKLSLKLNGRGHSQITYKGTKYLAHRVMACKRSNGILRKYPVHDNATKIQASHRCGYAWCVNPKHLVFEQDIYNQTRDCCHRIGIDKKGYRCPHSPKCIYVKGLKSKE